MERQSRSPYALLGWPLFWAAMAAAILLLFCHGKAPIVDEAVLFKQARFNLFGLDPSWLMPVAISRAWDIFFVAVFLWLYRIFNEEIGLLTVKRSNVKEVFFSSVFVSGILAYYSGLFWPIVLAFLIEITIIAIFAKENMRYAVILGFNAAAGALVGLGIIEGFGFSLLAFFLAVFISAAALGFSLLFKDHDGRGY